jgi:Variant SH3 domain
MDRQALVVQDYTAQYSNPIELRAGQPAQAIRNDDQYPGWLWCKAVDGREGWVPDSILRRVGDSAIAERDYSARELSVLSGTAVEVLERPTILPRLNSGGSYGMGAAPLPHYGLKLTSRCPRRN